MPSDPITAVDPIDSQWLRLTEYGAHSANPTAPPRSRVRTRPQNPPVYRINRSDTEPVRYPG
jgi:hypothetical protein